MTRTTTIVIGAGQAGLAASRCLTEDGIDHIVLDRGRVGERWRSERWDSLRMQTPRWQSRLPGWSYGGADPHGFMTMPEVIAYLEAYARSFAAPVRSGATVRRLAIHGDGYRVDTDAGTFVAPTAIIATGHCDRPYVPRWAGRLPARVHALPATCYRRPGELADGGVLVVGASATGVQLADELRAAGRDVTLAVGGHTRVPRRHRGRDIMWWLDAMGVLAQTTDDVRDLEAARRQPAFQLVGDPSGRAVDLPALAARGVRIVGRALDADGDRIALAADLTHTIGDADARAARIVDRIDRFAAARGIPDLGPAAELPRLAVPTSPTHLTLESERITNVIWATGFVRSYSWLAIPGVVAGGELQHAGGITPAPGLYALGLRFQRRRSSSFLDGVGADARAIVGHLAYHLGVRAAA